LQLIIPHLQLLIISVLKNTDGSIRAKKCLSGDGQIALDSDEIVSRVAVEYAKQKQVRAATDSSNKRRKVGRMGGGVKSSFVASKAASLADDNFVAVVLDSQGSVSRVYAHDTA
jgi:hypothetical protein